jgi:hypothetical protein
MVERRATAVRSCGPESVVIKGTITSITAKNAGVAMAVELLHRGTGTVHLSQISALHPIHRE